MQNSTNNLKPPDSSSCIPVQIIKFWSIEDGKSPSGSSSLQLISPPLQNPPVISIPSASTTTTPSIFQPGINPPIQPLTFPLQTNINNNNVIILPALPLQNNTNSQNTSTLINNNNNNNSQIPSAPQQQQPQQIILPPPIQLKPLGQENSIVNPHSLRPFDLSQLEDYFHCVLCYESFYKLTDLVLHFEKCQKLHNFKKKRKVSFKLIKRGEKCRKERRQNLQKINNNKNNNNNKKNSINEPSIPDEITIYLNNEEIIHEEEFEIKAEEISDVEENIENIDEHLNEDENTSQEIENNDNDNSLPIPSNDDNLNNNNNNIEIISQPPQKRRRRDRDKEQQNENGDESVPKKKRKKCIKPDPSLLLTCPVCPHTVVTKQGLYLHFERDHPGQNLFKCSFSPETSCSSTFPSKKELIRHHREHRAKIIEEQRKATYLCPHCAKQIKNIVNFRVHLKIHDENRKKHKCPHPECTREMISRDALSNHIQAVHEGRKRFPCPVENCDKSFYTQSILSDHMNKHAGNKFICQICGVQLCHRNSLRVHMRLHFAEKKYKCDVEGCSAAFKCNQALKIHKTTHSDRRDYHCACGNKYKTFTAMQTHQRKYCAALHPGKTRKICDEGNERSLQNGPKPKYNPKKDEQVECEICQRVVKGAFYKVHIQRRHGERTIQCRHCDQKYSTPSLRNAHERQVHLGIKPTKKPATKGTITGTNCPVCNKWIKNASNLRHHMRTHSDQKFPCSIPSCSKTFKDSLSVKRHIKAIHQGIKNFLCHLCDKQFFEKAQLDRHIQAHLKIKPFKCEKCEKSYADAKSLRLHHQKQNCSAEKQNPKPMPNPTGKRKTRGKEAEEEEEELSESDDENGNEYESQDESDQNDEEEEQDEEEEDYE